MWSECVNKQCNLRYNENKIEESFQHIWWFCRFIFLVHKSLKTIDFSTGKSLTNTMWSIPSIITFTLTIFCIIILFQWNTYLITPTVLIRITNWLTKICRVLRLLQIRGQHYEKSQMKSLSLSNHLQWWQLLLQQGPVNEVKVPISDE